MKILTKILSWLHHRSESNMKVVLSTIKSDGKLIKANVEYLLDGKFVNIKSFDNLEDATSFYNSLLV